MIDDPNRFKCLAILSAELKCCIWYFVSPAALMCQQEKIVICVAFWKIIKNGTVYFQPSRVMDVLCSGLMGAVG